MTSRLVLHYAARSDVGLVRHGNEDSGYAGPNLLAVADGMGGHAAGELASATAIAVLAELDRDPPEDRLTGLANAIEQAHDRLSSVVTSAPEAAGMGTTVTAMAWDAGTMTIAHVGDSRAYLLREGSLRRLTTDHTFVQTLVDAGRITAAQAATHQKRNLLMKAVDGVHIAHPDLSTSESRAGDRYLLCTDGLTGVVGESDLAGLLMTGDPTGAVTVLVDRALEAGAPDNVTCVVADVSTEAVVDPSGIPAPEPVVVGAAAELRTRDRLPDMQFPADAQLDPDRIVADELAFNAEPEAARAAPATGHRGRWLALALAVVGFLALAAAGVWYWADNQYFVGESNGYVAVYRGVPVGPGPHGWSRMVERSSTAVTSLPTYDRDAVVRTIPATSFDSARLTVAELAAAAALCQAEPGRAGCPPAVAAPGPGADSAP